VIASVLVVAVAVAISSHIALEEGGYRAALATSDRAGNRKPKILLDRPERLYQTYLI
jgi:hypothetical protein